MDEIKQECDSKPEPL